MSEEKCFQNVTFNFQNREESFLLSTFSEKNRGKDFPLSTGVMTCLCELSELVMVALNPFSMIDVMSVGLRDPFSELSFMHGQRGEDIPHPCVKLSPMWHHLVFVY